jgi:hypothetical protein
MRRGFGLLWALVTLAVVSVAGWFAYNAGVAQGLATSGHDGTVTNPGYYYPYYAHGWGFGFGLIPLLFFILLLLFLFRRPWGYRHWGGGYGRHGSYGYRGPHPGEGELPPPLEDRMRAWHTKAHDTAASAPGAEATGPQGQE